MMINSNDTNKTENNADMKGAKDNSLNKTNRIFMLLPIVAIAYVVFALADDILIRTTSIPYWSVSETYAEVVFSSLCTVAVLGSAIQSIVIGSFSSKIYGLTLKELLAGPQKRINIIKTLVVSFISIAIGLVLLALDFCTTITAVAICILLIIAKSSIEIWHLLSNDDVQKEYLYELIKSGRYSSEYFYLRWFSELSQAIENNDSSAQDIYIELIKTANASDNNGQSIEKNLKAIFPISCIQLGFVDAYKKILCFGEWSNPKIDTITIVREYFQQIQYCNEQSISTYRIPETLDDIFEYMDISDDEIIQYTYGLYDSVKCNVIISDNVRKRIISEIFNKICWLRDSGSGAIREKLLLYIAKHSFFENSNIQERNELWGIFCLRLFNNNRYNRDACYVSLLSQLFRALYFYSNLERETLTVEYRTELATLMHYGEKGKDNFVVTFAGMVTERSEAIVKWLTDDLKYEYNSWNSMFEHFSFNFEAKSSVWTFENCLRFSFEYYLLVGYKFSLFPAEIIVNDSNQETNFKKSICRNIVNCFDINKKLIGSVQSDLLYLRDFCAATYSLEDALTKRNFDFFNEKLSELAVEENEHYIADASCKVTDLNAKVVEELSNLTGFQLCDDIELNEEHTLYIKPRIRQVSKNDMDLSAKEKVWIIKDVLNSIIGKTLSRLSISFDQAGLEALLARVKNGGYVARNYTFVDDLALSASVRQSPEYEELCKLLGDISFIRNADYYHHVFLKTSEIQYNAQVMSYKLEKPTETQCEEYIASYKVADGKYRIDDTVFDHVSALKHIRDSYIVEYSEVRVNTNLDKESGFLIDFEWKSKRKE